MLRTPSLSRWIYCQGLRWRDAHRSFRLVSLNVRTLLQDVADFRSSCISMGSAIMWVPTLQRRLSTMLLLAFVSPALLGQGVHWLAADAFPGESSVGASGCCCCHAHTRPGDASTARITADERCAFCDVLSVAKQTGPTACFADLSVPLPAERLVACPTVLRQAVWHRASAPRAPPSLTS